MEMEDDVTAMSTADLESYLSKLQEDLEEVNEERMFVLGQTGLHVSAKAVQKYESDVAKLEGKIAEVEGELHGRQA
jgi:hypothetical protein